MALDVTAISTAVSAVDIASSASVEIDVEERLNKELAALSSKLVASIEKQASLEDRIHWTGHELAVAKAKIRELEAAQKECVGRMEQALIEKRGVEQETQQLMQRLMEETQQRGKAETDKRTIEKELEDLTKTLFEEANRMVSSAHRDRERLERRNEHLQAKLEDAESLLLSHQKQLAELKNVMQHMLHEQAETASSPSTPQSYRMKYESGFNALKSSDSIRLFDDSQADDALTGALPLSFASYLSFRDDIPVFQEFSMFFQTLCAQKVIQPVAQTSNLFPVSNTVSIPFVRPVSPTCLGLNGSSNTSATQFMASSFFQGNHSSLSSSFKDSKFFKRCISEDIEPTLRLDSAPGLSWLARRSVFSAILDGHLVIEPVSLKSLNTPCLCSLCGNICSDDKNTRIHQFRTSESQNTLKFYLLCSYCLRRVRSVCNFTGFIRQLCDGLWKTDDENVEMRAWEETVRLREAMFWSRVGAFSHTETMSDKANTL